MTSDGRTTVRAARDEFLRIHGLGSDGGYSASKVVFRTGPLRFAIPNTAARRRALPLHDIHHVITGYDSSWRGEGEIAAWELASGCSRYGAAWVLNLLALPVGLGLAPVRTWRAFRRGRRSGNLYLRGWQDDWLDGSLDGLRAHLERRTVQGPGGLLLDAVLFALCAIPGVIGAGCLVLTLRVLWMSFA